MTVVNWVASDTASWIFFGIGMLSALLAIVAHHVPILGRRPIRSIYVLWVLLSPIVVGPLLVLGGAVLAGTSAGRLSWLIILSGAICLAVVAYQSLLMATGRSQLAKPQSWWDLDFGRRDLARWIAHDVGREVVGVLSPSAIADAVYKNLSEQGALPSRTVGDFDDFAESMVRAGVWAPVSVYTASDDGTELKDATAAVLREFGLAIVVEEPAVRGSWFQRFWARSREVVGSRSVRERLAKLEEAVSLEYLGKRRAEIDKAKAESVAALLGAMKEQENAVVRIGSIIAIKTRGDLVVFTISEMEAAALERNSELLGDPVAALMFLRGGKQTQNSTGLEPPYRDALNE